MTQLSMFDAKDARDEALQQVEENSAEWFPAALDFIRRISEHGQYYGHEAGLFTGETIRHIIIDNIGKPHHPNAFGALIAQAKRKGYIVTTGKYVPSRDKHNHASMIAEYRWPE